MGKQELKMPTILFDGDCTMCNYWVRFVHKRAKNTEQFQFSPLQSLVGTDRDPSLPNQHDLPNDMSTLIYMENGKSYIQSTAVLRITRQLRFPYNLLYGFIIVPPFLRNLIYKWVAKNRHRFFKDKCKVPFG